MTLNYKQFRLRFPDNIYHHYGNASHAFYDILIWLQNNRPTERPNIVMPIYIPAKLYRFVLAAGYRPVFYDVSLNCQFDPHEVAGLIDDQTQAVFAIHYFGIPGPVKELKKLTEKAGVFLIEDCAHTLNSRFDGTMLGSIGDCAIFSIRKMLQLPSGGILALNNPGRCGAELQPSWNKRVRSLFTGYHLIGSRVKYGYYKLTKGHDPLNFAWIPGTGYIDFKEKQYVNVKKMSRLSEWYLNVVDLDRVAARRRDNFEYLLNGIRGIKYLKPVLPENFSRVTSNATGDKLQLREGIVPFSFPVLTPAGSREPLRQSLCRVGIGCGAGWPEAPFNHEGFDNTTNLSARLLELPIHQGVNVYQLQRIVECLAAYDFDDATEIDSISQAGVEPVIV